VTKQSFEIPDVKRLAQEEAALPHPRENEPSFVFSLKQKHEALLMSIDGVEGVGVGQDQIGNEAIVVYARDQGVADRVPGQLDGVSVQIVVTGPIEALNVK